MSLDCDISQSQKAAEANNVYGKEMAAQKLKKGAECWTVSPGLLPVQTIPVDIIRFLRNMYKDATFFKICRLISLLQWSEKWCGRFYTIDVGTLLALNQLAQGITVKNSTTFCPDVGLCLLFSWVIGTDEMVLYYQGFLVCAYPTKEQHKTKICTGRACCW